ncbi:hypothetical protein [Breoghania sp.]|uniref:hypothetical protein n=1 Tax=Breoghania sp. TaxID=2065378 RepID=UPI002618F219|nr:hypothetical protein [Breoghania sp.]MDJ0933433.1 hypothetical protein [Breoghania sp.]
MIAGAQHPHDDADGCRSNDADQRKNDRVDHPRQRHAGVTACGGDNDGAFVDIETGVAVDQAERDGDPGARKVGLDILDHRCAANDEQKQKSNLPKKARLRQSPQHGPILPEEFSAQSNTLVYKCSSNLFFL